MKNFNSLIIDLHTDYVMTLYSKGQEYHTSSQTGYSQLQKTGVIGIFSGFSYDDEFHDTHLQMSLLANEIASKRFNSILTFSDLSRQINAPNTKPGMLLHLEGGKLLGNDLSHLDKFYRQGVRSIGLTHNHGNQLATGCKDGNLTGLTPLGKKIVRAMNKLNMVVDASHINERGFYELLSLSTSPVIVTHGNSSAICPNPRNFTDSQIKDLSQNGGVIGVFFSAAYVNPDPKQASLDDMVKHCLHIAEVGGVEVLALGTDFGGITTGLPQGLSKTTRLTNFLEKLHASGFSYSDLNKICNQNVMRVMEKIMSK